MKTYSKIYYEFIKNHIKTNLVFTYDFILGIIMMILMDIPYVLFIGILFSGSNIAGWSLPEMMVLVGYVYVAEGIYDLIHGEIMNLPNMIISGGLDCYFIRPLNIVFQVLTASFYPDALSQIILGGILLVGGLVKLSLISAIVLIQIPFFIIISVTMYMAISVILCSFSFLLPTKVGFLWTFYDLEGMAKYPLSIFPKWLRYIFYTIIPIAFIFYEPVNVLLGKGGELLYLCMCIMVTFLTIVLAALSWKAGIKKYKSSGN